jgi:hypothetical protein
MRTRSAVGVGVAIVALGLAALLSRQASAPAPPAPPPTGGGVPTPAPQEPAAAGEAPAHFRPLLGAWLRPDGGYVLEVRSVAADGRASVAYSNPRPIRVARAEARREGELIGLFVEFDDHNYRGSSYALGYDAASERLQGIYYQATLRQRFEVVFTRRR